MSQYAATPDAVAAHLKNRGYTLAHGHTVRGQYSVSLWQNTDDTARFAVAYGCEFDTNLHYAGAAETYGAAVMHALTCAGRLEAEE